MSLSGSKIKYLITILFVAFCQWSYSNDVFVQHGLIDNPTAVLYNRVLNDMDKFPELSIGTIGAKYVKDGLKITDSLGLIRLNYYYALGERLIRYHLKFSQDTRAVFQSDKGQFKVYVDIPKKKIYIGNLPITESCIDFLDYEHEYIVEIYNIYQKSKVRIIDLFTGQLAEIEAVTNGSGGCGAGSVKVPFIVGRQHDYYCFGLDAGSEFLVKQICVLSLKSDLTLLLYGDSITEPEGYFPSEDFSNAWTQLIIKNVKGKAMSSGRGGTTIIELLERIKAELPYIKAKYVMITIGTNGKNTEENLSELIEYIISQGAIPILNNIPCNESGTQVKENVLIERVRMKYGIKGCKFDLATSVKYDGKNVDKGTMWFEDYPNAKIYHHPNVKGSIRMFIRTLIDVPEIYE